LPSLAPFTFLALITSISCYLTSSSSSSSSLFALSNSIYFSCPHYLHILLHDLLLLLCIENITTVPKHKPAGALSTRTPGLPIYAATHSFPFFFHYPPRALSPSVSLGDDWATVLPP